MPVNKANKLLFYLAEWRPFEGQHAGERPPRGAVNGRPFTVAANKPALAL